MFCQLASRILVVDVFFFLLLLRSRASSASSCLQLTAYSRLYTHMRHQPRTTKYYRPQSLEPRSVGSDVTKNSEVAFSCKHQPGQRNRNRTFTLSLTEGTTHNNKQQKPSWALQQTHERRQSFDSAV
jgi:hypothetical protein